MFDIYRGLRGDMPKDSYTPISALINLLTMGAEIG